MAAKSDFAQKLLHDLRLRKERMAATQNSGQRSNQISADAYVNHSRSYSGARQRKASQSASSRTENALRKSNADSRAINIEESSKQIVLSDRGQGSRQAGDLSTAIAFALENGGKLKITSSSNNPLVNFFNRFSRRSADSGKMKISSSFNKHGPSNNQFPAVSHIHINEISKGIQKLNQILKACSNGYNLDRNSIQVGKELLKGAMDLEESLKMLINLQEASEYMNTPKQKSRIKLLDEDEDDEDNNANIVDKRIVDKPSFSFDKHNKNSYVSRGASENDSTQQLMVLTYPAQGSKQIVSSSKVVSHKRSASCVPDLETRSAYAKPKSHSSSPQSTQDKGRISNVIAKLMGLEEVPQKEDPKGAQKDSSPKKKDRKVLNTNSRSPQPTNKDGNKTGSPLSINKKLNQTNRAPATRDPKCEVGKNQEISNGIPAKVIPGETPPQQNMKMQAVAVNKQSEPMPDIIMVNKQRNHTGEPNQVPGFQNLQERKMEENVTKHRERKITDNQEINRVLIAELQQKQQQMLRKAETEIVQENIEGGLIADHLPKRIAGEVLQRFPQKLQDSHEMHQTSVPAKPERSDKNQAEKSGQQLLKQNLLPKSLKGHQVERMIASKAKSKATSLQKKQSNAKAIPGNGKSIKQLGKVPLKDPPNRRQQDHSRITTSCNSAVDPNISATDHHCENSSTEESKIFIQKTQESTNLLAKEKPNDVPATQKKATPVQIRTSEMHTKIDVVMTRRNRKVNHLTIPLKSTITMHDVKQQRQNQLKEEGAAVIRQKDAEGSAQLLKEPDKLHSHALQTTILNNSVQDECQTQNIAEKLSTNDEYQDRAPESAKVFNDNQSGNQPYAISEAYKCKDGNHSTGVIDEGLEISYSHHLYKSSPTRQEQLTESEEHLKGILIKSQLFLNVAETLFSLNLSESSIHVGDHNGEDANMKLTLDCGYEVMRRKARRQEASVHPNANIYLSYTKVKSLDDLVKQLSKDLEMLKISTEKENDEYDVADCLYKVLNKDIHNINPDVNSMWDFGWDEKMIAFPEQDNLVRDVEKHMLNGLLDEITNDLLIISVSA